MSKSQNRPDLIFLGIDSGATRTVVLTADAQGRVHQRLELGPANLRLMDASQLKSLFESVAKSVKNPSAIGIGMAGVRDSTDERRITEAAQEIWPRIPCAATHDPVSYTHLTLPTILRV